MAALNEEQAMIKDQASSWVVEQSPVQKFRQMRNTEAKNNYFPETWAAMIDMGWTGIIVPEAYGGSDLGFLTFGLILEQTGRELAASPLFASALVGASAVILGGSEDQKQALLPKIVDGSEIATLAVDEGPRHDPAGIALSAVKSGSGFTLNGTKSFVLEGCAATTLIVAARTSGKAGETTGITLFLVPADATGLTRTALKTSDSRGYADISFKDVVVDGSAVLGEVDKGFGVLESTLDRARAGLGAEMLGTASKAFDMSLDYLKTRVQFGQVIGSFQALGHKAADLFTGMELTRSCVEAALQAIDAVDGKGDAKGADNVQLLCSLSKVRAGDYLHHASNELIQIHGGIGMTDEFDAGFYLKRARALETTYGNQAYHRNRYATLSGF